MGWLGMYVKRHAVVKGGKRYVYLRLAEAYRDESGPGAPPGAFHAGPLSGVNAGACKPRATSAAE
jgi:hypothetical protein